MKLIHVSIFWFFILTACPPSGKNYLMLRCEDENPDNCGYVDRSGNTIIPFGKYAICFTDTFVNFAIVLDAKIGFVGIDRSENVLFHVFPFDNGPDYPSEGLFRIIENEKMGFAALDGTIRIPPKFDAVRSFENGMAAFCEGCRNVRYGEHYHWEDGKWGFIDKKGKVAIEPDFDDIIQDFKEGKALVEKDGGQFFISRKGQKIAE